MAEFRDFSLCRRIELFHLTPLLPPSSLPVKHPFQSFFKFGADGHVDEKIDGSVDGRHEVSEGRGGVKRVPESAFGIEAGKEVPE